MRRNIIILFKLWVRWIWFSSIDNFCNSKNVFCEQLLITEVLEWFNSASMPYSLFGHWSVINYYTKQKVLLPKYSSLNPHCTQALCIQRLLSNLLIAFMSLTFLFLGRWLIAKIVTTVMILAHVFSLTRVKNWALFGRKQVGHLLAIEYFSDNWWKRLLNPLAPSLHSVNIISSLLNGRSIFYLLFSHCQCIYRGLCSC